MSLGLARRGIVGARRRSVAGPLVSDTFNRADNASSLGTADTGQAWEPLNGTWGTSGNQAYQPGAGTQVEAVVNSGVSDCTVTVTIAAVVPSIIEAGLCFRATDANNFWVTNGSSLFKRVAGNFTSMGSFAYSAGDVISAVLLGPSITMKKNGATILVITDAAHSAATKHGLRSNSDGTAAARWDDFSVTAP